MQNRCLQEPFHEKVRRENLPVGRQLPAQVTYMAAWKRIDLELRLRLVASVHFKRS